MRAGRDRRCLPWSLASSWHWGSIRRRTSLLACEAAAAVGGESDWGLELAAGWGGRVEGEVLVAFDGDDVEGVGVVVAVVVVVVGMTWWRGLRFGFWREGSFVDSRVRCCLDGSDCSLRTSLVLPESAFQVRASISGLSTTKIWIGEEDRTRTVSIRSGTLSRDRETVSSFGFSFSTECLVRSCSSA